MNIESLREQFDELGVDASQDVLEKCLDICQSHALDDPVEFVEKWMAYSISNLNGAEPTVQFLVEMENREYKHQSAKSMKANGSSGNRQRETSNLKVYNQGNDDDEMDEEENELLGSYVCITPKNDKKAASRLQRGTPDVANTFSPVSYSPLTTAKRSRIESKKAGSVCTFGKFAAATAAASNASRNLQNITISLADLNGAQWLDEKIKYMTTTLDDGQYVTERIFKVGHEFSKKILHDELQKGGHKDNDDDRVGLSHCDELSQESVRSLGKIFCGGRSNQLDQKSCVFIGFDENKIRAVPLDLTRLRPSAQIFPGEICIVGGNNPRGKSFTVTELHAERILNHCRLPSAHRLSDTVNFVVASGPYSSSENLLFEYLDKLVETCQNNKPDVLILTGEFFSAKSKLILDLATDTEEHFRKMLTSISERLGEGTKVVVVSSVNDINSSACYPTRPYAFRRGVGTASIFLAPDPCILDVNGIKVGVTSVDITQHLAESEFCMNAGGGGGDKMRRYMNYIFHQKSFYPLFPPKVPTDTRLLHEYATINELPHIFVAPSDLKYYMRDFNNCLCVNPGRIGSADGEGTFARITVQPPPKESGKGLLNAWISGQISYL